MKKTNKKVVIVGAGPAGLSAAYYILKNNDNIDLTIVEKTSCVGGISASFNIDGNMLEYGPHRYFSKNKEVLDF